MNLLTFYAQFHFNDQEKVKNWIFDICLERSDIEKYIEADVSFNRGISNYFSLLKLVKYNANKGTILIESNVMKYITPHNFLVKKKHGVIYGVVNKSTVEEMVNKQKAPKGYVFAIRFFFLKPMIMKNDKVERYTLLNFKNDIYPYAQNKSHVRQIVDANDYESLLFDFNIEKEESAIRLANSIEHDIKKDLATTGLSNTISFAIGVVSIAQHYQEYDDIVESAEQACIYAHQNDMHSYLYDRNVAHNVISPRKYIKQIDTLIKNNNLRYLYRPIIDTSNSSVLGYFLSVKGYNTPFSDYLDIARYAQKANKNKELFSVVSKNAIAKFSHEGIQFSDKLFITVSIVDVPYIIEVFNQITEANVVKITLLFKEQELSDNSEDTALLNNVLSSLKANGLSLALQLDDRDLLLDPSVYINFDYFIVGYNMVSEIKKSNRSRLSIHTLVEQLLKYRKPIIANELVNWHSIELIIKSGIYIISSEIVASSSDMLLPVDKHRLERLSNLYNHFN